MTTRVFDFGRDPERVLAEQRAAAEAAGPVHKLDLRTASLASLVLAPVAGAAVPPDGWVFTGATAATLLLVGKLAGARVPWGWVAAIAAALGFLIPRGQWAIIGPVCFVATLVSVLLRMAQHNANRPRRHRREATPAQSGRTAQIMLGLSGERHAGRVLAAALPQEYVLINGLALPRGAGDIDHLVIGPTGLFLLETKTMAGEIVCDAEGKWHRTKMGRAGTPYPAYIGDPAAQVQRNIFAVRQLIRQRLPELSRSPLWIEGLVVFAHPHTELAADSSRVPAVRLEDATRRICEHVPRYRLQPRDVDALLRALLAEARPLRAGLTSQSAQALLETALLLPVVLALAFGTLAISRLVQTHSAVVTVAHEAARAGALATNPSDAVGRMQARALAVADGLGLDRQALVLEWDLTHFSGDPGRVEAIARYPLDFGDLPMVSALGAPVVSADHIEWVDPFRSGLGVDPALVN